MPLVNALDSETIIGCGGDEQITIGCLGDEELFFIGRTPVSIIPIIPENKTSSTGGTPDLLSGSTGIRNKSLILCNLTYASASFEEEKNRYKNVTIIKKEFLNLTNYSSSEIIIKIYIDNWQGICSDLLNRSLNEPFLCNKIYELSKENDLEDNIWTITTEINKDLKISKYLVTHYIDNFDKLCFNRGFSPNFKKFIISKDLRNKLNFIFIWIIISMLIILIVFYWKFIKKKKKKNKKLKNLSTHGSVAN